MWGKSDQLEVRSRKELRNVEDSVIENIVGNPLDDWETRSIEDLGEWLEDFPIL